MMEKYQKLMEGLRVHFRDGNCNECPYNSGDSKCFEKIMRAARSIIKSQKRQIQEYQKEIIRLLDEMEESRWIPCSEQMPPERETIFAKFRGTDKWKPAMFERMSEDVRIVAEYPDGYRRVHHSYTVDGQWEIERKTAPGARAKVLFWMKNPKLPKEEK